MKNFQPTRKIIHIDMDAFYASIEQRDNPNLKDKAIAVGGGINRGVVATASYQARRYGVKSAMPVKTALQRCKNLIIVPPRFQVYKHIASQIREIFDEYSVYVEPISLDEAFLDVTVNKKSMKSATLIAMDIKRKIKSELNLTASAGVSINKFLAKIASDYNKPDGLFVITPQEINKFVENLPIEKFFGIGRVTTKKMKKYGIFTGADLKKIELAKLINWFGKSGHLFHNMSHGIDNREVNSFRIRKSVSVEDTFPKDIFLYDEISQELEIIAKKLFSRIKRVNFLGHTLTLKVKYADFKQITRSKTFIKTFDNKKLILLTAVDLLKTVNLKKNKIRLLGLGISNEKKLKSRENNQLTLNF